jgi:hypothetical protein
MGNECPTYTTFCAFRTRCEGVRFYSLAALADVLRFDLDRMLISHHRDYKSARREVVEVGGINSRSGKCAGEDSQEGRHGHGGGSRHV